jgi:hypothetical protein
MSASAEEETTRDFGDVIHPSLRGIPKMKKETDELVQKVLKQWESERKFWHRNLNFNTFKPEKNDVVNYRGDNALGKFKQVEIPQYHFWNNEN